LMNEQRTLFTCCLAASGILTASNIIWHNSIPLSPSWAPFTFHLTPRGICLATNIELVRQGRIGFRSKKMGT
jgi:hypothetical protein